jgi:ABC-2 type transport system permease protein
MSDTTVKLTFVGILRSEWIKFWSLRSTYWCFAIMFVLWIGIGLLLSAVHGNVGYVEGPQASQQAAAAQAATAGINFGELIAGVLGVLIISGEYGTGMIRSSFTADPRRIPTLVAKGIVLGFTTFVAGLVSIYVTAAITFPILAGEKVYPIIGDGKLTLALFGAAAYLTIISLIAFSIGAILRVSAGGIAAALGLILVVPGVFELLARVTQAVWASNVGQFTPTSAGSHLYGYPVTVPKAASGAILLDATTGPLVLLGWFVVLFVVAAVLVKRRDA